MQLSLVDFRASPRTSVLTIVLSSFELLNFQPFRGRRHFALFFMESRIPDSLQLKPAYAFRKFLRLTAPRNVRAVKESIHLRRQW